MEKRDRKLTLEIKLKSSPIIIRSYKSCLKLANPEVSGMGEFRNMVVNARRGNSKRRKQFPLDTKKGERRGAKEQLFHFINICLSILFVCVILIIKLNLKMRTVIAF